MQCRTIQTPDHLSNSFHISIQSHETHIQQKNPARALQMIKGWIDHAQTTRLVDPAARSLCDTRVCELRMRSSGANGRKQSITKLQNAGLYLQQTERDLMDRQKRADLIQQTPVTHTHTHRGWSNEAGGQTKVTHTCASDDDDEDDDDGITRQDDQ